MKTKHDTRQGVYLAFSRRGRPYVGSTAGGRGRGFDARRREHERAIAQGTHPNNTLRREGLADLRPLVVLPRGDVKLARKVEGILIKALGQVLCNERR